MGSWASPYLAVQAAYLRAYEMRAELDSLSLDWTTRCDASAVRSDRELARWIEIADSSYRFDDDQKWGWPPPGGGHPHCRPERTQAGRRP